MIKVVRKIKAGDIEVSTKVISRLASAQLLARNAYWLMRNFRSIEKEYRTFSEVKDVLLEKYAKKDENGGFVLDESKEKIELILETAKEYWEEYAKLLNEEIDVAIFPMRIEQFEGAKLSAAEINVIYFLLEEEVEENALDS